MTQVHAETTADGQEIILLAQGPDHEIAGLARLLPDITPLTHDTVPAGGVRVPLSWPAVVQLTAVAGSAWTPGPFLRAWIEQEITRRTVPDNVLHGPVPPHLTPRWYQVEAAAMIRDLGGAVLCDDMGTGKTISAILGVSERACAGMPALPVLVVCPASVVENWVREFRKWCPRWRTVAWRGTADRRKRLLFTADVYVTSYETARTDAADTDARKNPLIALQPAVVVADELHRMKHQASQRSLAVRRLAGRAHAFVGLSGTPITHSPADLWPALVSLAPSAYPSRERWVKRYCHWQERGYSVEADGLRQDREAEFRLTLLGQMRRVSKADVAKDLPPKVWEQRYVDIPGKYRVAYDQMETDMLAQLPDGQELEAMEVLTQINRLIQLASSAGDVSVEEYWHEERGKWAKRTHFTAKDPCWKLDALMEILEERTGQTVVFGPSTQLMKLAATRCYKAGIRTGLIVGGQTHKQRQTVVDKFQAGELDVICANTAAGGVGITLTAADCCVFVQRPWGLDDALQAEDRLHRIGAEHHESIQIIDIIARNTIESRIREVLRARAGQLSELVQDPRIVAEILGGASVTKLSRKRTA